MRSTRTALLAALLSPLTLADVKFTSPQAGLSIPAGTVQVQWTDSGSGPPLNTLSTYTLQLYIGGNNPNDAATAKPLAALQAQGQFSGTNSFSATIDPGLAGSTPNGFYLKMTSVITDGGTVINYSPRFSLTGMTGTTDPAIIQAVTALNGATAGPPSQNNAANNANGAAGATGAGAIPYNLQTGLTKYAPMQPIPSTAITVTQYTPLYPTSAYTVARKPLPPASIIITVTASQTQSFSSMENQASPASQPTGDMAKYLARWKD